MKGDRGVCADCGKPVVDRGPTSDGRPRWKDEGNVFICRGVIVDGKLKWADYHYVEGEEQRHFTAKPSYPEPAGDEIKPWGD